MHLTKELTFKQHTSRVEPFLIEENKVISILHVINEVSPHVAVERQYDWVDVDENEVDENEYTYIMIAEQENMALRRSQSKKLEIMVAV
jgi:hypothetical protein